MSRRKINVITVVLLVLGFGGALAIFLTAPPDESGDNALLNDPRAQRLYQRQLAMYGGKANVLSAEFLDWFDHLWEGRALAGTVSVLTVAGTLAFRFFATLPPRPPAAASAPGGNQPPRPGA